MTRNPSTGVFAILMAHAFASRLHGGGQMRVSGASFASAVAPDRARAER
jgi:hypothetical protein